MESQHLRLRRTKIKLTDFSTVKVIGKGAFGEVIMFDCSGYQLPLTRILVFVGAVGSEGGYWESVRNEKSAESGNVETRSGAVDVQPLS
jgi:hypothetical protein